MAEDDVCPISHIPVREILHPVVFRKRTVDTVYSAEHVVEWLKNHSLLDPVSHEYVEPNLATEILEPWGGNSTTRKFLVRAGVLDGIGGKVTC